MSLREADPLTVVEAVASARLRIGLRQVKRLRARFRDPSAAGPVWWKRGVQVEPEAAGGVAERGARADVAVIVASYDFGTSVESGLAVLGRFGDSQRRFKWGLPLMPGRLSGSSYSRSPSILLPGHGHQVGAAMHDDPRLARARTRQCGSSVP